MGDDDRDWMAYIDSEVRAACEATACGYQIRRKWSERGKPVAASPVDDYEWKLIPGVQGRLQDEPGDGFSGTYYVLGFNRESGWFDLQHDTSHVGIIGPHWERTTSTAFRPNMGVREDRMYGVGWLRDHLVYLVEKFAPNSFCIT